MKTFGGQSPPGSGLGIPHPPGAYPGTPPRRQAATRPIIQAFFFLAAPHALRFLLAQSHGLCCAPATDQSFLFYACEEQIIPAGLFRNKGGGQQQMPCSWWLSICFLFVFLFGTENRPSCQIMLFICFSFTGRRFRRH